MCLGGELVKLEPPETKTSSRNNPSLLLSESESQSRARDPEEGSRMRTCAESSTRRLGRECVDHGGSLVRIGWL
ncbi:unnamed protein product [Larinioides sclopetarius]|uniref:Uncharacterized protein n=1 Tax=Larinioides sclopetarius TaxID=280406 RepID=A0AAV2AMC4_9ARAC